MMMIDRILWFLCQQNLMHQPRFSSEHDDGLAKVLIGSPVCLSCMMDRCANFLSISKCQADRQRERERQTLHFQVFSTYISAFVGQFVRKVSTSCPRSQRNHLKRGQCFVKASTLGKYKQGSTRRVRFARPKSIEHKSKVTVLEQVGAHRVTWVWSKNRALEAISLCFAVCAHFKNDLEQTSSIWVIEGVNIYILSL